MANFKLPTIEELYLAGVHFGHQSRRWHPRIKQYLFTEERKVHVIDLEKTLEALKKSCDFLQDVASKGGVVVFVGSKRQAREVLKKAAEDSGAFFINERWPGGALTNFEIVKKNSIDKLNEMTQKRAKGEYSHYTKKEQVLIDREILKLERMVGGVRTLKKLPDALFIVDIPREHIAVSEAKETGVPVAAIVDTNSDPTLVTYPIPGNDDGSKSIKILVETVGEAVRSGYEASNKAAVKTEVTEEVVSEKVKSAKRKGKSGGKE